MNERDAKKIAEYIASTLGKTGINIKLCINRLKALTDGIELTQCCDMIRTAFEKNQKSSTEAVSYLALNLLLYGAKHPIPGDDENVKPAEFGKETKYSIQREICDLLKKLKETANCAGYNQGRKENEPKDSESRKCCERLENSFANEASKLENDIVDLMEILLR